jgi:DNA-directed RNA polymerase subunit RPC12/RpoP
MMNAHIENQAGNNSGKPGFDRIRKQIFTVGNWLCGTLQGIGDDNHDRALVQSLEKWLSQQAARYDGLSIGYVRCTECGNTWETLTPTSTVNRLECPECGHRETLAVERGTPEMLKNEMKLHIPE